MSDATRVHVIGLGAETPVGRTFPATMAAVRGAISRFTRSDHLRDRAEGEPITVARLSTIPATTPVAERMRLLAAGAAAQALAPLGRDGLPSGTLLRVHLAVPPPRPGFPHGMPGQLTRVVLDRLPVAADLGRSTLFPRAHAGGLAAIASALSAIRAGEVSVALVGGVDSAFDIDALHFLEVQGRLKTASSPRGVLPGEAAAFLLLASDAFVAERGLRSFGEIVAVAAAIEPHPWYTRRPTRAEGLTQAAAAVLAPDAATRRAAAATYADLDGEGWRADEWSLTYVRIGPHLASPLDLRHPASSWGDVGAASATLLTGAACLDLHDGDNRGDSALVLASADVLPHRSACFVRRAEGG